MDWKGTTSPAQLSSSSSLVTRTDKVNELLVSTCHANGQRAEAAAAAAASIAAAAFRGDRGKKLLAGKRGERVLVLR